MSELYLMRHGQTLFNARHRIQGACDSPLTPLGIEQARRGAKLIEDVEFDHAYCSTAERCADTLEIVRPQMSYERLKGIRERNFGVFEGESEDLSPRWDNAYDVVCPPVDASQANTDTWDGYDATYSHFGGETYAQVRERAVATLTEVMRRPQHEKVLAVSSAGTCRQFLCQWCTPEQIAEALAGQIRIPNCAIMRLSFDGDRFELVSIMHPDMSGLAC